MNVNSYHQSQQDPNSTQTSQYSSSRLQQHHLSAVKIKSKAEEEFDINEVEDDENLSENNEDVDECDGLENLGQGDEDEVSLGNFYTDLEKQPLITKYYT